MSLSTQLRIVVWTRDRGICGLCGECIEPADYEVDHIIHRHAGGSDAPDNLRAAHRWCNRKRPDREVTNPPRRKFDLSTPAGAAAYHAYLKETTQRRRRYTKACVVCGREFTGLAQRRFCSGACRQRDYYQRRRQRAAQGAQP